MELVAYNNNKDWQHSQHSDHNNTQGSYNNTNNNFQTTTNLNNDNIYFSPNNDNNLLTTNPSTIAHHSNRGRRARRSGQKLYTCEHPNCGLSFYRSYTLYRHQRIKHGQRLMPPPSSHHLLNTSSLSNHPLKCPYDWCMQSFNRPSQLHKHTIDFHQ